MSYQEKLFRISSKLIELDDTMDQNMKALYLSQLKMQMVNMQDLQAKIIYDGMRDIFMEEFKSDKVKLEEGNVFG